MSADIEFSQLPEGFDGIVRLFPLPNLVMFPHVIQPLHIFEPRYCAMMEDALAHDQLITMAYLDTGWEKNYHGAAPISSSVCIGKIVSHTLLPEGKFNLLLLGVRRARIIRELPGPLPFRQAKVSVLDDVYAVPSSKSRDAIRCRLIDTFQEFIPQASVVREQIEQLLQQDIPLGVLTDMVAHTMSLELSFKLRLLAEPHVDRRATMLVDHFEDCRLADISDVEVAVKPFPPAFSLN